MDLFILGDIVRRFNTAYRLEDGSERPRLQRACHPYDARGRLETRSARISPRYLRTWFAVDLLCLINSLFNILEVISDDPFSPGPLSALRVVRVFQVLKVADSQSVYILKSVCVAQGASPPA